MWTLGVALGLYGKWLTLRDARSIGRNTPPGRTAGWFLLWPGMDGRAFFAPERAPAPPLREWLAAIVKLALGIALLIGRLLITPKAEPERLANLPLNDE